MKTYDDFPLKEHASGRFYLKVKGKYHYFGPLSDPEGALRRYQEWLASNVAASGKAAKPTNGPLWWHEGSKQWCKVIKGKREYFGSDKAAALRKYKERDKPSNGQVRGPAAAPGELTLLELVCRLRAMSG